MDWLTFIVEIIKASAWPITIVIIIILLRRPILKLIPEISKFKFKNLEIEFDKGMREVAKQAEKALPELKEVRKTFVIEAQGQAEGKAEAKGKAELIDVNERFRRLAEFSPPAAVLEAWLELEMTLRRTAAEHGLSFNERSNPLQLLKALMNREKVDLPTYEIFEKLRDLRNHAVHARSTDLTANQALEYREIANRLSMKLRSLAADK